MKSPAFQTIALNPKRMKIEMGNCSYQQKVEPDPPSQATADASPKLISFDGTSPKTTKSCSSSPRRSTSRSSQSLLPVLDEINQTKSDHHQNVSNTSFGANYQLLFDEILGHGIAGVVHKCIHRQSSKVCAVKVITKAKVRSKARIKREIALLQRVQQMQHPNIIQLYDVFEDETTVFIVTELCRGGELYEKIVNTRESRKRMMMSFVASRSSGHCFRESDAARIIHDLLSAVSCLHSLDIVHRDLKPENILLINNDEEEGDKKKISINQHTPSSVSSFYTIKLIDFGLSTQHTSHSTPLSSMVGTSYYMSPEVISGSYNRTCDLWSIGVITYAMLSGRPPFNGTDTAEIISKIRNCEVEMERKAFWNGIPNGEATDFIQRLMVKDPKMRYTTDMALHHPWIKKFVQ